MKKSSDKTQGVVFVLPKSKEFFGRISEDFQKVGHRGQDQKIISQRTHMVSTGVAEAEAQKEIQSLKELKENLSKLSQLHNKLKQMLDELDAVVEDDDLEKVKS
ncbi:MAG: hypothetical protein HYY62_03170 [Deltaproteobacteria bacterium]|nr:hypothetical protein [Deltaproteobacteria bacterium]